MKPPSSKQLGQTLIETLVATFMLVMGITAALGLATFSLHSSTNIVKQVIGMGLAREGLESVKNMRDTNWLQGTLSPSGCYNFRTNTAASAPCYLTWLNPGTSGYNIKPASGGVQSSRVLTDPTKNNPAQTNYYWNLQAATPARYGLKFDSTGGDNGFYYSPSGGIDPGDPDTFGTYYYREVIVTEDTTTAPYNVDPNLQRLKVESRVWWTDKGCPQLSAFPVGSKCSLSLTIYLTNWKNYQ